MDKNEKDKRERKESGEEKSACVNCGRTSEESLLITGELQGGKVHVCARCLPFFIHGTAH